MLAVTHVLFSIFLSLLFILFGFPVSVVFVCILGSLVPDIDSPFSTLGKHFKFLSWFFRHRGFFHSIFAAVIFSLLFLFVGWIYSFVFFVGFGSHLLLDSMTKKGIKPFVFGLRITGSISSGGVVEMLFLLLLLLLNLYLTIVIL